MSKATMIFIYICALLVVLCLFACLFSYFFGSRFETNTHELSEEFCDISIFTDTADIDVRPSDDGTCKIVCYERENQKHFVSVSNGVLTVQVIDTRKWYEHLFSFSSPSITVYLPKSEYDAMHIEESTGDIEIQNNFTFASIDLTVSTGDIMCYASTAQRLRVKTSTGDITVEHASAGAMELSVSTGKVTVSSVACTGDVNVNASTGDTTLSDVTCKNVITNGSTGDVFLRHVLATEMFSIKRSTGDVTFDSCDASELFVETDTGDVNGTLLTAKKFIAHTDTGCVNVPNSENGGRCEITTDTGDIKIRIQP